MYCSGGLLAASLLLVAVPGLAEPKMPHRLLDVEPATINPRYLLVGPDGQAVSNEDFRGQYQLLAFGYTYCPDVCPTTLVEMSEILKSLGDDAARLQAIFISVDPERDTPASLKTYTAFFDPRIIGLTGSEALLRRAAQNFRIRYAKVLLPGRDPANYSVDHSAGMFLLGPDGQMIKKFAYGQAIGEMTQSIREIISQRGSMGRGPYPMKEPK